jgi:mRNA interferase RelE/StbE
MESFEVLWKRSAEHDIRKIDHQYIPQILKAVEGLAKNPFPVKCRKLKGSGSSYRIRIGNYRVIYQVNTRNNQVIVYHVRHRRDAYR